MAGASRGRGFDLHVHSNCSDGTEEVEDVVAAAATAGLEGLALTDHDTLQGIARAQAAADAAGLELVPGTEFSAELDGWSVHLLGLWVDPDEPVLAAELHRLRNERSERAERIVERFQALGAPVSIDRVRELAGPAPIGRPHIAAAVVETGFAADEREVFDRWLRDGGPANVPKHAVDPRRAVELLRGAGGVAVLAHPALRGRDDAPVLTDAFIAELAEAGLAGLEVDHPDHPFPVRDRLRALAARLDLVPTGGSDFHGTAKPNRVGDATTTREALERLRSRSTGH
jgi:3',5'-nucleoside bisphosphate phosphatase